MISSICIFSWALYIGWLQSVLPALAALGAFCFVVVYPLRDGTPVES